MGPLEQISDIVFASPTLIGVTGLLFCIGVAWFVEQVRTAE